uniref:U10-Saltitoxin-Pre1a_1 n=1 Tax=Phidippus regius TaxID=1905328 RepID=A0A482Z8W4_9ARAC
MLRIFFTFLLLSIVVISTTCLEFKYCPKPVDDGECPLAKRVNECCSNDNCRFGQICCSEPCGNVCRVKIDSPEGKEAAEDKDCKLGEVSKKWYQKIFDRAEEFGGAEFDDFARNE